MNDMYSNSRTLTESWQLAEFEGEEITSQAELKSEHEGFLLGFWPFLNDYYSPLNPVFSPMYGRFLRDLREGETAWLRDGIVPLTWFLRQNSPQSFRGRLIVADRLASLVPEEWRPKFSFYKLIAAEISKPKTIYIAGPVHNRAVDLGQIEYLLDAARKKLGRNKVDVKLFCPVRGQDDRFPAEFLQRVFSHFPKLEVLSWHTIANLGVLKDSVYLELNGDYIFSDSYVQFHMLSRGAGLLLGNGKGKANVALSRFHGAAVSSQTKNQPRAADEPLSNYSRLMEELAEESSGELWPESHESWCRGLK